MGAGPQLARRLPGLPGCTGRMARRPRCTQGICEGGRKGRVCRAPASPIAKAVTRLPVAARYGGTALFQFSGMMPSTARHSEGSISP